LGTLSPSFFEDRLVVHEPEARHVDRHTPQLAVDHLEVDRLLLDIGQERLPG
jgi:hypothetical protein